jgi:hypothetical protein
MQLTLDHLLPPLPQLFAHPLVTAPRLARPTPREPYDKPQRQGSSMLCFGQSLPLASPMTDSRM